MKILWIISAVFSVIGGIVMLAMIGNANSAIGEAAGAAIGVAFAVIPYCFVRAIEKFREDKTEI